MKKSTFGPWLAVILGAAYFLIPHVTKDKDGEEGEDYRLQVSFKYAFSSNDFR